MLTKTPKRHYKNTLIKGVHCIPPSTQGRQYMHHQHDKGVQGSSNRAPTSDTAPSTITQTGASEHQTVRTSSLPASTLGTRKSSYACQVGRAGYNTRPCKDNPRQSRQQATHDNTQPWCGSASACNGVVTPARKQPISHTVGSKLHTIQYSVVCDTAKAAHSR